MKLATRQTAAGPRVAVVRGDRLVDVPGIASMLDFIVGGEEALAAARGATGHGLPLTEAALLPPIGRAVRNLFCVGWNYRSHFEEGAGRRGAQEVTQIPDHPTFFTKATTTLIGPYDRIPAHAEITQRLDWEVELAVVIGRGGSGIREWDALGHVFGYTVANDVSAREIQRGHGGQWFKGKSLDGTCPLGPWIVTADEVHDPQSLDISCTVNNVVKQRSSTKHMVFTVRRIIAELSAGLTLLPGDVILTGTPEGVGSARTPPEFLKAGDLVISEVSGIGMIRNEVA